MAEKTNAEIMEKFQEALRRIAELKPLQVDLTPLPEVPAITPIEPLKIEYNIVVTPLPEIGTDSSTTTSG